MNMIILLAIGVGGLQAEIDAQKAAIQTWTIQMTEVQIKVMSSEEKQEYISRAEASFDRRATHGQSVKSKAELIANVEMQLRYNTTRINAVTTTIDDANGLARVKTEDLRPRPADVATDEQYGTWCLSLTTLYGKGWLAELNPLTKVSSIQQDKRQRPGYFDLGIINFEIPQEATFENDVLEVVGVWRIELRPDHKISRYVAFDPSGKRANEQVFSDYREVSGIQIPHRIIEYTMYRGDPHAVTKITTVTSVQVNPKIDPAIFKIDAGYVQTSYSKTASQAYDSQMRQQY